MDMADQPGSNAAIPTTYCGERAIGAATSCPAHARASFCAAKEQSQNTLPLVSLQASSFMQATTPAGSRTLGEPQVNCTFAHPSCTLPRPNEGSITPVSLLQPMGSGMIPSNSSSPPHLDGLILESATGNHAQEDTSAAGGQLAGSGCDGDEETEVGAGEGVGAHMQAGAHAPHAAHAHDVLEAAAEADATAGQQDEDEGSGAEDGESCDDQPRMQAPWLYHLVTFPGYFTPCPSCCGATNVAPKREQLLTLFDLEARRVFCSHCPQHLHRGHPIIQVRAHCTALHCMHACMCVNTTP
jgi:hypothetical protein